MNFIVATRDGQSEAETLKPDVKTIAPCQVFLIEDDVDDRILAQRELESCEFVKEVIAFKDGKELIDYMKEKGFMDRSVMLYTPVLLLVDLEMPRKDGLQVLKELKSDPFLEPIPLIVLTGTEDQQKMRKAMELGASGVFKKPLNNHLLDEFFKEAWKWPPQELWC